MLNTAGKTYDFMKIRIPMIILSLVLTVGSIAAIAVKGFNFALDFTGGTLVEVEFAEPPVVSEVREKLQAQGFSNVIVQRFGTETSLVVRLQQDGDEIGEQVVNTLRADGAEVELRRSEYVGSQVGEELREKGGLALLLALGGILVYVAMRFQFKFAISSVIALVHDVIVTLGAFALFQWDFDLTVLAAILAIIGYSLNDSIVVFDRIRENFRKIRKMEPLGVVNVSLTQTLARTLVTSGTTLLVTLALFVFGGEAIHYFALALLIGVGFGTYSSIYVATAIALMMGASKEDFLLPQKEEGEGSEADLRP